MNTSKCRSCHGAIERGFYCAMCLGIADCQERIRIAYDEFLATLPRYEDAIGSIMARVARFEVPAEKLAGFQAMCGHYLTIELRKDDLSITICQTCGMDIHPF
jgi:hypothetical protein